MTATRLPPGLIIDLNATLARLRVARDVGDDITAKVNEQRLNWLLAQVPLKSE